MLLFSVIVVHYQGTVPHHIYLRGIQSLMEQTFKDFEILVYHDGPALDPALASPLPIRCTPTRYNDWGHSLRDRGIHEARGEYILHFNADNLLYPQALQTLADAMKEPNRVFDAYGRPADTADLLIFPIVMHDHVIFHNKFMFVGHGSGAKLIMTGNPPEHNLIDCMQLVMKRDIWLAEGGWSDKSRDSDAKLYKKFTRKYGYRGVGAVLGEHF